MEHQVFAESGRAVSRPPPERTSQGRAGSIGGATVRHLPARDALGGAMTARARQPTPALRLNGRQLAREIHRPGSVPTKMAIFATARC